MRALLAEQVVVVCWSYQFWKACCCREMITDSNKRLNTLDVAILGSS